MPKAEVDTSHIPPELTGAPQWVTWASVMRDGKPTKVPYTPGAGNAKVNDPTTWRTIEEALAEVEGHAARTGIGFVLTAEDPYIVIDLDHCVVAGVVSEAATSMIDRLESYAELSPSKTGVHIWLRGQCECNRNRLQWGDLSIEIYQERRFMTVTGYALTNGRGIEERTDKLHTLLCDIIPPVAPRTVAALQTPQRMDDQKIIDLMFNSRHGHEIKTLWHGDLERYGNDDSAADFAMASQIAFWTQDPEQIERVMRLSCLAREKWDKHKTYLTRTISKVLASKNEHYSAGSTQPSTDNSQRKTPKKKDPPGPAQSEWMLSRVLSGDEGEVALFYTADNTTYIRILTDDLAMTWPVKSLHFRQFLRKRMFELRARAFRDEDLKRVVDTLDARAAYDGVQQEAYLRVAPGPDGEIYIDLRNDTWDVVKVSTSGWEIVHNPPVLLRRGRNSAPLPTPQAGGAIDSLREFLNVDDEQWMLLASVLVGYVNPTGPYPVLSISGEQGSGKSTTCRIIKRLVDPAAAELYSMPDAKRDVLVAAQNNWLLAYENLSGIPTWLSDVFCVLATGGGFSSRELYTDMDERVMSAQRPIITNGIPDLVTRPDLLSRAIPITLAPIKSYRTERQFYTALDRVLPQALGCLLDAASVALANIDEVEHDSRIRMADFARWAAAAAPAFGWTPYDFLDSYASNRETAEETILETSAIATVLLEFANGRKHYDDAWTGTASELYEKITPNPAPKDWPKNARALSSAIRRYAPVLRSQGIDVQLCREAKGLRRITIKTGDANLLDFASPDDRFASPKNVLRHPNEHGVTQMTQVTQKSPTAPDSKIDEEFKQLLPLGNNIDTNTEESGIAEKVPDFASPASPNDEITTLYDDQGNETGVIL